MAYLQMLPDLGMNYTLSRLFSTAKPVADRSSERVSTPNQGFR